MSEQIDELMRNNRWVYWINEADRRPDGTCRVSIVIENQSGHFPTGENGKEPWYWGKETCKLKNAERGFDEMTAYKIVSSSMFKEHKPKPGRALRVKS